MSQAEAIGGVGDRSTQVRAAIARAAETTGVDFDYLLAQAKIESSLDPAARAATSSAAGLYQFTGGTWLATLDRHGASHGLGWAENAIDGGRVSDPMMRAQIRALRFDPSASALMAAELANDNRAELQMRWGEPRIRPNCTSRTSWGPRVRRRFSARCPPIQASRRLG